jgi:hypothetical protein
MGCNLDYSIIKAYPEVLEVIFMSSAEDYTTIIDSDKNLYIADNPAGYLIEMDRLGQAPASVGSTKNNNLANSPYSTYLRPVSDLSELFKGQKVFCESIKFFGYDLINEDSATQDAAVNTVIFDSRTALNSYVQANGFNTILPTSWQPNFFRPTVRINDRDVITGISKSNYGNKQNIGDMSIGLPIPYCQEVNRELGEVKSINAYAQLAQIITMGESDYKFMRYGVQMIITFRLGTGTVYATNG